MGKFPPKKKSAPKFKKCRCVKVKNNKPGQCPDCKGTGQCKIVHSRNKGNNFERDVAKDLTKWTGSEIARTPSSGGWAKTGDLTPKAATMMLKFPFCVELKNRQGWDMHDLLKAINEEEGIQSWWRQCINDAAVAEKIPVLIFTRNFDVNYIMMWEYDFLKLPFKTKVLHFQFEGTVIFKYSDLIALSFDEVCKAVARG
jgi:Holliday junction resolvase